jgi:hypothetical protein
MTAQTKEVQLVRQGDMTVEYGGVALILFDDEPYMAAVLAIRFFRAGCPVVQIYIPEHMTANSQAWEKLADDITTKIYQIGLLHEKFKFLKYLEKRILYIEKVRANTA